MYALHCQRDIHRAAASIRVFDRVASFFQLARAYVFSPPGLSLFPFARLFLTEETTERRGCCTLGHSACVHRGCLALSRVPYILYMQLVSPLSTAGARTQRGDDDEATSRAHCVGKMKKKSHNQYAIIHRNAAPRTVKHSRSSPPALN